MASTTSSTTSTARTNVSTTFRSGLQNTTSLSDDGVDWLVSALDPFSSSGITLAGYPDNMGARSVVMEKVASITLSGAQLANGTCSVYMAPYVAVSNTANPIAPMNTGTLPAYPLVYPNESTSVSFDSMCPPCLDLDGALTSYYSGGLVVNTDGPFSNFALTQGYATSFTTNQAYSLGHGITAPHRVVGMGFEVLNETAPLYKSGNVVVYEHPLNSNDTVYGVSVGGTNLVSPATSLFSVPASVNTIMGPPVNQSQMLSQLNSAQWPAEHGAYCVSKMESSDAGIAGNVAFVNYPEEMTYHPSTGNSFTVGSVMGGEPLVVTLQGVPDTEQNTQTLVARQNSTYLYNFNGCGAFFTGLDVANTSLHITARWIIEVFPSPLRNGDLIPLATASASFDPEVLNVYGKISQFLPPGLPSRSSFIAQVPAILRKFKKKKNGRTQSQA